MVGQSHHTHFLVSNFIKQVCSVNGYVNDNFASTFSLRVVEKVQPSNLQHHQGLFALQSPPMIMWSAPKPAIMHS